MENLTFSIPELQPEPEIIQVEDVFNYRDEYNFPKKIRIDFSDKLKKGQFWGLQRAASWYIEDYYKLIDYHNKINILSWLGNSDAAFKMSADFNIFIRK